MMAPNRQNAEYEKLMAVLLREPLTLTTEKQERLLEQNMRPTVFEPRDVAVHKV